MNFPELRRKPAFDGLPGLLADSLPDDFGNRVIRRYFEQRGSAGAELSPVQRLLYLGPRAMGALEFEPAYVSPDGPTAEALEVASLVSQARNLIAGDAEAAMVRYRAEGEERATSKAMWPTCWTGLRPTKAQPSTASGDRRSAWTARRATSAG